MIDSPTAIQKIDWVLEFVATSPFMKGGVGWQFIYDKTREMHPELAAMDDWGDQLNQILEQLEIEGNVKHLPQIVSGGRDGFVGIITQKDVYKSTFKGGFFHSKNGYQGQIDRENAAERRQATEDQRNKYQYLVSLSVSVLTGMMAVYYLVQLYDGSPKPHPYLSITTFLIGAGIYIPSLGLKYLRKNKNELSHNV